MRPENVTGQNAGRPASRFAGAMVAALAMGMMYAAACGGPKAVKTPGPAPTPAAKPAPPAAAPAAQPAPAPAAAANPPAAAPPAAGAPGAGRGGRGGGPPAPPPELPPSVMPKPAEPIVSATKPSPDPRVGLKAGRWDAGEAGWNLRMISTTPPSPASLGATHSDLAFTSHYAIQGNYNGFEIWDISNPAKPVLTNAYTCPASQNDISVYKNLLFMSSESTNSRSDCKFGGVPDQVSTDRVRGVRIFDISDIKNPKLVTSVQNCRGSHTHTLVTQPGDPDNVYIYISGTSGVRPAAELPGCQASTTADDPNGVAVPYRRDPGAAQGAADGAHHRQSAHLQRAAGGAGQRRAQRGRSRGARGPRRQRGERRCRRRGGGAAGAAGGDERWRRGGRGRGQRRPRGRPGWRGAGDSSRRRESVPRHHGLSADRPRGRRVRGAWPAARHP